MKHLQPATHRQQGMRWTGRLLGMLCLVAPGGCGDNPGAAITEEPDAVGGPPLVRRLTESQYRSSIADIFGPDTPVVARFERAQRVDGLIAVATSAAGISSFAIEQYDMAANGVADHILAPASRLEFVPCAPDASDAFDEQCARQFVTDLGTRLFRRPLTEEQVERHVSIARAGAAQLGDFYAGLKYTLIGLMTAPEFIFRIERVDVDMDASGVQQLDDYSSAARLSFFLTDSTPDRELLRAAANGELRTREGLAQQVDRLLASPRLEAAVRAFFTDMLEFDLFEDLAKDAEIYPAFNSDVAADAREQTLRDIVDLLITQQGDYRDLFTLEDSWMTRDLGVIYRQPVSARDGWEKTPLSNDGNRRGIQSQISFVALHAHPGRSSPTLRGKAIRNVFLCQEVPDPPPDVNFSVVQDSSNTSMPTARDRLSAHNDQPACSGCHKVMDPVGLALENFDGVGAYRENENAATIDASGFLDGMSYDDAVGLASALHDHPETPRCVVEKMYRFAVGRDTVWKERAYMDYLIARFKNNHYRLPALMRSIAMSDNFFAVSEPDSHGAGEQLATAFATGDQP